MALLYDYIDAVLTRLEEHYRVMADSVAPPVPVRVGSVWSFRFSEQTDTLACFLKGVKLLSTLNAASILQRAGYAQEVAALCRMADDFQNEILFLMEAQQDGKPSKDQVRFCREFFQEEFTDPDDVLGSSQSRDIVPRKKIHAAFGRLSGGFLNPSDAQNTLTVIHRTMSGYVHGAYPQIMDLYGGEPPRFHVRGMAETVRQAESARSIVTYTYRALMSSSLIARKLGLLETEAAIRELLSEFENVVECRSDETPAEIMRKMKK